MLTLGLVAGALGRLALDDDDGAAFLRDLVATRLPLLPLVAEARLDREVVAAVPLADFRCCCCEEEAFEERPLLRDLEDDGSAESLAFFFPKKTIVSFDGFAIQITGISINQRSETVSS